MQFKHVFHALLPKTVKLYPDLEIISLSTQHRLVTWWILKPIHSYLLLVSSPQAGALKQ
jgi:hypothetical protein